MKTKFDMMRENDNKPFQQSNRLPGEEVMAAEVQMGYNLRNRMVLALAPRKVGQSKTLPMPNNLKVPEQPSEINENQNIPDA